MPQLPAAFTPDSKPAAAYWKHLWRRPQAKLAALQHALQVSQRALGLPGQHRARQVGVEHRPRPAAGTVRECPEEPRQRSAVGTQFVDDARVALRRARCDHPQRRRLARQHRPRRRKAPAPGADRFHRPIARLQRPRRRHDRLGRRVPVGPQRCVGSELEHLVGRTADQHERFDRHQPRVSRRRWPAQRRWACQGVGRFHSGANLAAEHSCRPNRCCTRGWRTEP